MVFLNDTKLAQTYEVIESEVIIEDSVYREYGINQISIYENNLVCMVKIEGISTEKEIVQALIERIANEEVYPITLQYVVEDYLGEISDL